MAFKNSLAFLKNETERGVKEAQDGVFGSLFTRSTRSFGDQPYVVQLRDFGAQVAKALRKQLGSNEEVAAMMLVIALDAAHKSVMTVSCSYAGSAAFRC